MITKYFSEKTLSLEINNNFINLVIQFLKGMIKVRAKTEWKIY